LKTVVLGLLAGVAAGAVSHADEPMGSPVDPVFLGPDWQDPLLVPARFRNHCSFDITHGRVYCAERCGFGYQFYHCSRRSFGCCHIGEGYCGWDGLLRCRP
jgi:hypothetical protein